MAFAEAWQQIDCATRRHPAVYTPTKVPQTAPPIGASHRVARLGGQATDGPPALLMSAIHMLGGSIDVRCRAHEPNFSSFNILDDPIPHLWARLADFARSGGFGAQKRVPGTAAQAYAHITYIDAPATDRHHHKATDGMAQLREVQADNYQTAEKRYHITKRATSIKRVVCGAGLVGRGHYLWACQPARAVRNLEEFNALRAYKWEIIPPIRRRHGIAPALSSRLEWPWWEGPADSPPMRPQMNKPKRSEVSSHNSFLTSKPTSPGRVLFAVASSNAQLLDKTWRSSTAETQPSSQVCQMRRRALHHPWQMHGMMWAYYTMLGSGHASARPASPNIADARLRAASH